MAYLRRRRMRRRGRTFRRRRIRRSKGGKRPGYIPGSGMIRTCLLHAVQDTTSTVKFGVAKDMTNIPLKSELELSTQKINVREHSLINLRGWRLGFYVRLQPPEDTAYEMFHPGTFHSAIIAPKTSLTVDFNDFFRTFGEPDETNRGQDFSNSSNYLLMDRASINPDKFYILQHKKYEIRPFSPDKVKYTTGKSWVKVDQYIPFNRQLRYNEDDTIKCTTPIYWVHWITDWSQSQNATYKLSYYIQAMFRNSQV